MKFDILSIYNNNFLIKHLTLHFVGQSIKIINTCLKHVTNVQEE